MKFLLLISIFLPLLAFLQDQPREEFKRHFIEISPTALTFKKGINFNQHLEYRCLLTKYLYLNAGSTFTIARKFDYSRNHSVFGIRPLYNESYIKLGYLFALNSLTDNNRKVNLFGVELGYQYTQYSTNPYASDYDIIDSTEYGLRNLGGYQVHSIKLGFNFQRILYTNEQNKPAIRSRHYFGLNFLYGIDYQFPSFISLSSISAIKSNYYTTNLWQSAFGGRMEYTFGHLISKKVGLLYGFNFTWNPWPKYIPNYNYFVPRGGEPILPATLTLRVGITIQ